MIVGEGLGDMVGLRGAGCIHDGLWAAVQLLEAYSAGAEVVDCNTSPFLRGRAHGDTSDVSFGLRFRLGALGVMF